MNRELEIIQRIAAAISYQPSQFRFARCVYASVKENLCNGKLKKYFGRTSQIAIFMYFHSIFALWNGNLFVVFMAHKIPKITVFAGNLTVINFWGSSSRITMLLGKYVFKISVLAKNIGCWLRGERGMWLTSNKVWDFELFCNWKLKAVSELPWGSEYSFYEVVNWFLKKKHFYELKSFRMRKN